MLSQAVDSIVKCTSGLNFQDFTQAMSAQKDNLFGRILDSSTITSIRDFLINQPNFDPKNLEFVDNWVVYLGNQHSHLVGFWKGCSNLVLDLDLMLTHDLLRVLGVQI